MSNGLTFEKLTDPPYLQIAIDTIDMNVALDIVSQVPKSERIIIEAGTPLIKSVGASVIRDMKNEMGGGFFVADLKTMDTGKLEVTIAYRAQADAVTVSGCASKDTMNSFIAECKDLGVYSIVDCMDVANPFDTINSLGIKPNVISLHRGIDEESGKSHMFDEIKFMKAKFRKSLISVAGGIDIDSAPEALKAGADIVVVGRKITDAASIRVATGNFLEIIEK